MSLDAVNIVKISGKLNLKITPSLFRFFLSATHIIVDKLQ